MSNDWCTIESDPAVLTELVERFGVEEVQFTEVYEICDSGIESIIKQYGNIYGLMFLFKYTDIPQAQLFSIPIDTPVGMFYAHQVINNACATQAVLSILLNRLDINIGPHLKDLKDFTQSFDPNMCGLAIGNSDILRSAHNSFKPISSLEFDTEIKGHKEGDAFHYICYVPFRNAVYEIDGLASGVVLLGHVDNNSTINDDANISTLYNSPENWVPLAIKEIRRRVSLYNTDSHNEIRFSLMAIVPNALLRAKSQLLNLLKEKQRVILKLMSYGEDVDFDTIQGFEEDEILTSTTLAELPNDIPSLKRLFKRLKDKLTEIEFTIKSEELVRLRWKEENNRRRHDFFPFVLAMMKHASKKGLLTKKFKQLI
ncbi:putative ubiquitin carboxyl-terminal hydrolase, family 1 protein [Cryptosporidium serpentis]